MHRNDHHSSNDAMSVFTGKRILVTGATGLVGYNLIERLIAVPDIEIIALGRSSQRLTNIFGKMSIKTVEHNITNPINSDLGHIDFIFHAASPISGAVIRETPVDVINANISGIINCLEYIKRQGNGKVIVFSSATVYGASAPSNIATEKETFIAEDLDSPTAPYSESKRMIEVIANAYHKQFGINVLIIRLSYVYGYSPNPAKTAFYEFIFKALSGQDITMRTTGLPRRDNIYIDDVINALIMLCSIPEHHGVYNIASNGDMNNYAAADEIAEIISHEVAHLYGRKIKVEYQSVQERPEGLRLSNTKLKAQGWAVNTPLELGIRSVINRYHDEISQ